MKKIIGILLFTAVAFAVTQTPETRRIFWNRVVPAFSFSGVSGNPLGSDQHMNVGPTVFKPEDYGAVMNIQDITQAQATANYAVINSLISACPDSGCVMEVTGHLQYYGTINNPQRIFPPQTAPRPIPFTIRGSTPDAALVNLQPNVPAVVFQAGYSFQIGSTIAPYGMRDITVYSKGDGIDTYDGGKSLVLTNVTVSNCSGVGLNVHGLDGGQIQSVLAISNNGDGVHIDNAHMDSVHIDAYNNLGDGIVVTNSAVWDGFLDAESNQGYGINIQNSKDMRLTAWMEANNGSKNSQGWISGQNTLQGYMRGDTNIHFMAINGQESNTGFDTDSYSKLGSTYQRISDEVYLPYSTGISFPPIQGNIRGFNGWTVNKPTVTIQANQVQIAVPKGAYSTQPINVTGNWLELYGYGWYPPLTNVMFQQGDAVIARMKFKLDAAAAAYFTQTMATGNAVSAIRMVVQGSTGVLQTASQNVFLHDLNEVEAQVDTFAVKSGTDYIRVFIYLNPAVMPGSQPVIPHNIFVTGLSVYHLPK